MRLLRLTLTTMSLHYEKDEETRVPDLVVRCWGMIPVGRVPRNRLLILPIARRLAWLAHSPTLFMLHLVRFVIQHLHELLRIQNKNRLIPMLSLTLPQHANEIELDEMRKPVYGTTKEEPKEMSR